MNFLALDVFFGGAPHLHCSVVVFFFADEALVVCRVFAVLEGVPLGATV